MEPPPQPPSTSTTSEKKSKDDIKKEVQCFFKRFCHQYPVIDNRYTIIKQSDDYPSIFIAVDEQDANKKEVVVKMEVLGGNRTLDNEKTIIQDKIANSTEAGEFLQLIHSRRYPNHRVLVLEKAGNNLQKIKERIGRFSLKTTLILAKQMLTKIKMLHKLGIVHRGIKPDNFVIGDVNTEDVNKVYLIDFDLARQYRDGDGNHIQDNDEPKPPAYITGNWRFMSLKTNEGSKHTRRDDVESAANSLIWFHKGTLPWIETFKSSYKKKKDLLPDVAKKKAELDTSAICPDEPIFGEFLEYCRQLEFDEEPDYDGWISRFDECLHKHGYTDDGILDWYWLPAEKLEMKFNDLRSPADKSVEDWDTLKDLAL